MSLFIIYKIENHRDRIIDGFYGPYDSYDAAIDRAFICEKDVKNYNGKHRLYDYNVAELSDPMELTF